MMSFTGNIKNSCGKIHCQEGFDLIMFSCKTFALSGMRPECTPVLGSTPSCALRCGSNQGLEFHKSRVADANSPLCKG